MDMCKYITNRLEGLKTNIMCKVKISQTNTKPRIHTLHCNYVMEVLSVRLSGIVLGLGWVLGLSTQTLIVFSKFVLWLVSWSCDNNP